MNKKYKLVLLIISLLLVLSSLFIFLLNTRNIKTINENSIVMSDLNLNKKEIKKRIELLNNLFYYSQQNLSNNNQLNKYFILITEYLRKKDISLYSYNYIKDHSIVELNMKITSNDLIDFVNYLNRFEIYQINEFKIYSNYDVNLKIKIRNVLKNDIKIFKKISDKTIISKIISNSNKKIDYFDFLFEKKIDIRKISLKKKEIEKKIYLYDEMEYLGKYKRDKNGIHIYIIKDKESGIIYNIEENELEKVNNDFIILRLNNKLYKIELKG